MRHPLTLGLRDAHHVRQRADGQFLGAWSTKSAPLPAARSSSTMVLALAWIESSMRRTCRGVNAALHELAELGVPRRVHRQERLRRLEQFHGDVLEHHPLAGQEHLVVAADRGDVRAPGDRPIAGVVGIVHQGVFDGRMPAHRAFGPQHGKRAFPVGGGRGPERARGQIDRVVGAGTARRPVVTVIATLRLDPRPNEPTICLDRMSSQYVVRWAMLGECRR